MRSSLATAKGHVSEWCGYFTWSTMSELAYIYIVRVYPRRNKGAFKLLGNCDGKGAWLGDAVRKQFKLIDEIRCDPPVSGDRKAVFDEEFSPIEEEYVGCSILLHEHGVRSQLNLSAVDKPVPRTEEDSEVVRLGVMARFPAESDLGYLAIHRSRSKSASRAAMKAVRNAAASMDMTADIKPLILHNELVEAVEHDRVTAVKLTSARGHQNFSTLYSDGSMAENVEMTLMARPKRVRALSRSSLFR